MLRTRFQCLISMTLLRGQALVLWVTVVPVLVRAREHFRRIHLGLAWAVPLPQAATAPRAYFDKEIYMHPSLKPNAMGWHPVGWCKLNLLESRVESACFHHVKLTYERTTSNLAFNFNVRHYILEIGKVWRGYPNVATKTTF